MRNNMCNTTFLTYKISNPVVDNIFFRDEYYKVSSPITNFHKPSTLSNLICNGFAPRNVMN